MWIRACLPIYPQQFACGYELHLCEISVLFLHFDYFQWPITTFQQNGVFSCVFTETPLYIDEVCLTNSFKQVIVAFFDNILVYGKNENTHKGHFANIMYVLQENQLILNANNSEYLREYSGHIILLQRNKLIPILSQPSMASSLKYTWSETLLDM